MNENLHAQAAAAGLTPNERARVVLAFMLSVDADATRRAFSEVALAASRFVAAMHGMPKPPRRPFRREWSGMTARQYRADRRRWNRECRAYRKALSAHEAAVECRKARPEGGAR